MNLTEVYEIAQEYEGAWEEYFGQEMYYIKYDGTNTTKNDVYNEAKTKVYDTAHKLSFYGMLKFNPTDEEIQMGGLKEKPTGLIIFVTKMLFDKGIKEVDTRDVIQVTLESGETKTFNIVSKQQRVQLLNHRIFTRIGVKENA